MTNKIILVLMGCLMIVQVQAVNLNVVNLGANGDGKKDNTIIIQKAIDKCALTGGQVIIPQGVFQSGAISIKSNVTLVLESRDILQANVDS